MVVLQPDAVKLEKRNHHRSAFPLGFVGKALLSNEIPWNIS